MAITDDELEDLYEDHILRHAEQSEYRGKLAEATWTGNARNPVCGDVVRLELARDDAGRVRQARFDGRGCLISQATASMLCEFVEGESLGRLARFTEREMLDLTRVPLSPARRQCALVAYAALRRALDSRSDGAFRAG